MNVVKLVDFKLMKIFRLIVITLELKPLVSSSLEQSMRFMQLKLLRIVQVLVRHMQRKTSSPFHSPFSH